jgi:hypothetical protein
MTKSRSSDMLDDKLEPKPVRRVAAGTVIRRPEAGVRLLRAFVVWTETLGNGVIADNVELVIENE